MKVMFPYLAVWNIGFGCAFYADFKDAKKEVEKHKQGYVSAGKKWHVFKDGKWTIQKTLPVLNWNHS